MNSNFSNNKLQNKSNDDKLINLISSNESINNIIITNTNQSIKGQLINKPGEFYKLPTYYNTISHNFNDKDKINNSLNSKKKNDKSNSVSEEINNGNNKSIILKNDLIKLKQKIKALEEDNKSKNNLIQQLQLKSDKDEDYLLKLEKLIDINDKDKIDNKINKNNTDKNLIEEEKEIPRNKIERVILIKDENFKQYKKNPIKKTYEKNTCKKIYSLVPKYKKTKCINYNISNKNKKFNTNKNSDLKKQNCSNSSILNIDKKNAIIEIRNITETENKKEETENKESKEEEIKNKGNKKEIKTEIENNFDINYDINLINSKESLNSENKNLIESKCIMPNITYSLDNMNYPNIKNEKNKNLKEFKQKVIEITRNTDDLNKYIVNSINKINDMFDNMKNTIEKKKIKKNKSFNLKFSKENKKYENTIENLENKEKEYVKQLEEKDIHINSLNQKIIELSKLVNDKNLNIEQMQKIIDDFKK